MDRAAGREGGGLWTCGGGGGGCSQQRRGLVAVGVFSASVCGAATVGWMRHGMTCAWEVGGFHCGGGAGSLNLQDH